MPPGSQAPWRSHLPTNSLSWTVCPWPMKGALRWEPHSPFSYFSMWSWRGWDRAGSQNSLPAVTLQSENGPASPLNSRFASKSLSSSGFYDSNDLDQRDPLVLLFFHFLKESPSLPGSLLFRETDGLEPSLENQSAWQQSHSPPTAILPSCCQQMGVAEIQGEATRREPTCIACNHVLDIYMTAPNLTQPDMVDSQSGWL